MNLILSDDFYESLSKIEKYIAQDSPNRALKFAQDLKYKILSIRFMPYRFRKNLYAKNENIRDLIFKGYVIPFKIEKNVITILDIYNQNKKKGL